LFARHDLAAFHLTLHLSANAIIALRRTFVFLLE
jgi:hypothetical protein